MSFNIDREHVAMATGAMGFLILMTKYSRDLILQGPRNMHTSDRDSNRDLDGLREMKNYGTEATTKSKQRQNLLDTDSYLAAMPTTFRTPMEMGAKPAQYYTGDAVTMNNPVFDQKT